MKGNNYLEEITLPRHGGRVEEVAESRGIDPESLVDFSANMNPLAPPDRLEDYLLEAAKGVEIYPDDRYRRFRKSTADFLEDETGTTIEGPENVVPGNGSVEIFRLFLSVVSIHGGEKVLVPFPSFGEYGSQARLKGLEVDRVRYGEMLDYGEELGDYDAVFLCNPNNPTGILRERAELEDFVARCRSQNVYLLVDEAFIELARPEESLVAIVPEFPNLIVVRSLTKDFSVPGLRLGFGVATGEMAGALEKLRPPWNVNCIAARLGSRFLEEQRELLVESRDYLADEREWLTNKLRGLGFSLYPSSTNFLLFRTEEAGLKAEEMADRCLDYGVLIRNADSFYGLDEWHVRVAVRKREDNRKLVRVLEETIEG